MSVWEELSLPNVLLQVYKAMLKGVNPVAVKVLRDQSYTSRDEFGKEVALLKALHNSNIVQFQVSMTRPAGTAPLAERTAAVLSVR